MRDYVEQLEERITAAKTHGSPSGAFLLSFLVPGLGLTLGRGPIALLWPGAFGIVGWVILLLAMTMAGPNLGVLILMFFWNGIWAAGSSNAIKSQRKKRFTAAFADTWDEYLADEAAAKAAEHRAVATLKPGYDALRGREVRCPSCSTVHTFASLDKNSSKCPNCSSDIWNSSEERLRESVGAEYVGSVVELMKQMAQAAKAHKARVLLERSGVVLGHKIQAEAAAIRNAREADLRERQTAAAEATAKSMKEIENLTWQQKWDLWPK